MSRHASQRTLKRMSYSLQAVFLGVSPFLRKSDILGGWIYQGVLKLLATGFKAAINSLACHMLSLMSMLCYLTTYSLMLLLRNQMYRRSIFFILVIHQKMIICCSRCNLLLIICKLLLIHLLLSILLQL